MKTTVNTTASNVTASNITVSNATVSNIAGSRKVICAGHVCIDLTPLISGESQTRVEDILQPGKLLAVGPAAATLGGSVSNTGLGMKLLGADVSLMGKIGTDSFGDMIYKEYSRYDAQDGLIRDERDTTSYSIVVAIPGIDRFFLHHAGANDTFSVEDIPWEKVNDTALFHFGYPPIMRRFYLDEGAELAEMFERVHAGGAATSLDMAAVDPGSEAGRVDWQALLARVLPLTDFFVPSVEELCFMLDRERFAEWQTRAAGRDVCDILDPNKDIRPLADRCMALGCKVLMIKCGAPGMYLRTAPEDVLNNISPRIGLDTAAWAKQDIFERSYRPDRILSGTGAGDTSIAAFLTAVLQGETPEWAMHFAAASGACCITELDALSGLRPLPELRRRIEAGWEKN